MIHLHRVGWVSRFLLYRNTAQLLLPPSSRHFLVFSTCQQTGFQYAKSLELEVGEVQESFLHH